MARNEQFVHASPEAVFDVLADPRGYAYWVLGSQEIRDADRDWPAAGSCFHHTVRVGPLQIKDDSEVEEIQPGRFLQLKVKARPLGSARVQLQLQPASGGTRVTMLEDPADSFTALVFTPLMHLLVHKRNARSLDRLADIAEGRVPLPGEERDAPRRMPGDDGSVQNPLARRRSAALRATAATVACGAGAGLAGAIVMGVSTNAEMRLRRRAPSDAPARAIERLFGVSSGDSRQAMRLALAGHVATSVALGATRAVMAGAGVRSKHASATLYVLALLPEIVIVPSLSASPPPWRWSKADWAITVIHHGVYGAVTNVTFKLLSAHAGQDGATS